MSIEIITVDDHPVVRIGLRAIFAESEIKIVAEAKDGKEAFALCKKHRPAVVLLNIRMPQDDGLSCLSRLKLDVPDIAVVMISASDSPTYTARAVALGASGLISKSAEKQEIIDSIRAVARGDQIWSEDVLRKVTGALAQRQSGPLAATGLTPREDQVLKQIALGLTNKEIAMALGISYETVKEHVQHVLRKLEVSDRTQAAVWAVRNDLV